MATTRTALEESAANVDESMGVRKLSVTPQLSPVASAKDVGRKPLREFGQLKIRQLLPDPTQPRQDFDSDEISRLAASIRKNGQLHPIRVRWDAGSEKWIIVTGERRFHAAVAAGLDEIDCSFHEDGITESETLEQQLVENLLRQDLKPMEEARGYASLMSLNKWNGKQVAAALHVSPSRVSRALALLDLPVEVQSQIQSGAIPRTAAYELTKLDSASIQRAVAQKAAAGKLTQRQTAKAVRQRKGKSPTKLRGTRQAFLAENGVKVTVTARSKLDYFQIKEALQEAIAEVRIRIDNNIQIF